MQEIRALRLSHALVPTSHIHILPASSAGAPGAVLATQDWHRKRETWGLTWAMPCGTAPCRSRSPVTPRPWTVPSGESHTLSSSAARRAHSTSSASLSMCACEHAERASTCTAHARRARHTAGPPAILLRPSTGRAHGKGFSRTRPHARLGHPNQHHCIAARPAPHRPSARDVGPPIPCAVSHPSHSTSTVSPSVASCQPSRAAMASSLSLLTLSSRASSLAISP